MMRPWLVTLALMLPGLAQAQAQSQIPAGAPAGMQQIDAADLEKHASHLASDELGGRYTGTEGQVKAAEYIAKYFKTLGLLPLGGKRSYFQKYPVERTYLDPKATSITIGQKKFIDGFAVVEGKKSSKVKAGGGFAFCGRGNPEGLPRGLKRKIPVVILKARSGGPRARMGATRSLQRAASVCRALGSKGAKLVVFCVLEADSPILDTMNYSALLPGKHLLRYPKKQDRRLQPLTVPAMFLSREPSLLLLEKLGVEEDKHGNPWQKDKKRKLAGKVAITVKVDPKFHALNVVAYLKGRSLAKEAIVFSAHMDHMGTRMDRDPFNGADDNASGTAGLLEVAQAFVKGETPKRSVVFLSVSGEELGLWGSFYFSENPTWPLAKIVANINIDMIGRSTDLSGPKAVSATPSPNHNKFSTLVRDAARLAEKLGLSLTNGDTYYQRSDHYNFARKGVPVVFFCDGEHEDYHKVTDHADLLNYEKMESISRLAYWTGFQVAEAKGRPRKLGRQNDWLGR